MLYVHLTGFLMVTVRAEKPRQPCWPAGVALPVETQIYQDESVVLGQARRPAPLKVRLSFASTAHVLSSNRAPRPVSPLLKYWSTPWPVPNQISRVSMIVHHGLE